jgi:prophage regulatory protein
MTKVRLITKRELTAMIAVSYPTIWRWMRAGKFPRAVGEGRIVRWRLDEVEAWIEQLPPANGQLIERSKLPETQRNDPKRQKVHRLRIIAENGNGV